MPASDSTRHAYTENKGAPSERRLSRWSGAFYALGVVSFIGGLLAIMISVAAGASFLTFVLVGLWLTVGCAIIFAMSALLAGGADVVRLLKLQNELRYDGTLRL